ncbi:tRNA 5-methylaminomethyl-2-thiouridine biosynthesis bifunctional protein [Microbulbifer donghaiensis]|uniref:tRNA 5-methylaminomethyl-2-thiouridine biosynthesis bifunctional protein MnmC n=1 Tax=Microbulbifer donghaiensis TaxID=494016 RepID=A0A1M5HAB1_9GAMM|nr:bifunctional tRNA (5-methylaminomethyl-2-thiouridine)(34)-methyltransferase MnmD/FAD-dependent 5-carboxymethylaminomethyl-2-thiouridine(34) oxidoreductase MnmC [Microbulbifer donghaiensis]SHG12861.1 tRNA 5-methylaminomethyl-2-thiouridine biosynthesis bifunctional protein [Microbulbifer donghaiensis]
MSDKDLHADIEWRDDGLPLSRAFDDIYFSTASGLEESRYVFLQQNDLPRRWAELGDGDSFTIGETGFGTGLNFLAAWELWLQAAPANAHLNFITVEKYPLRAEDLQRALALWPQLQPLAEQLSERYPPLLARGVHRLHFGRVSLTLVIGEASEAFRSLRLEDDNRDRHVDAWFLDGFAPSKNPDMWTPELFENIAALSKAGATFATFTCAGLVKRGLQDAGFTLKKVPGFGHKREMLRGQLETTAPTRISATPWHLPHTATQRRPKTVAVIGAGVSGATVARALAERGIAVQVFDQGSQPGAGASGNEQGILYAKLSPKPGPNGDFNLHALMFAQRYYREHCADVTHFGGLLQLAQSDKEQQLQQQIGQLLDQHKAEQLARMVNAEEASAIAGVPLNFGGLYFPTAGWIEPQRVCATLLQHRNIALHCATRIDTLIPQEAGWQLCSADQEYTADAVVICSAHGIRQFAQTTALPLRPIRGQVSNAPASTNSRQLQTTLCGEGYIAPVFRERHSFGATFKLKETETELREEEHRENLDTLAELLPQVAADFAQHPVSGRAAVRAATPDYLPMAGPVPDWESVDETYADLRKNRKLLIQQQAAYQPALYVLGGLGSRGFTYAPLAAEVLAGWLCGEAMPVSAELVKALHPARFAIRALGKNR